MDAKIIFGLLGFLTGAAAGGVASYFVTKKRYEDLIDDLDNDWNERYRKLRNSEHDITEEDRVEPDITEEDHSEGRLIPDVPVIFDEKVDNNEGVKRYHRPLDTQSLDNAYKEAKNNVTEGEKALVREDQLKAAGKPDPNYEKVYEITEDQWSLEMQEYDKVTLDYYIEDDVLVGTDPEEIAEVWYKCGREDLIGKVWRWAPDYIREGSSDGAVYVRNDNMSIDFEVICHTSSYKEVAGLD